MIERLKVSAAVFRRGDSVLLMRRGPNQPLPGTWEYPGGKFEAGESGHECIRRELREELGINVKDLRFLFCVTHNISAKRIMELYVYEILSFGGDIKMSVHDKMEWVPMSKLVAHSQLPADLIASQRLANSK